MLSAIGLLLDQPQIPSSTLEIFNPPRQGVLEILYQLEI